LLRIGIDIGGTFTDGVLFDSSRSEITHAKVSTTPSNPLDGLRNVLERLGVDAADASIFVHGTTLVTNLILQRTGCRVGMITTQGFRDVLEIQRSYRPEPLDLQWVKPEPLVPRDLRLEVDERTYADGSVAIPPTEDQVLQAATQLVGAGVEAIALCFFNSYANRQNEETAADWIREAHPDVPVVCSSEVDPQIREYERWSTTTINAYAVRAVSAYIETLRERVRPDVLLMHSGGGVVPAAAVAARPVKLVQSGPAGGVIAARRLGTRGARTNLITFDMGGTSTDVATIVDGEAQWATETEITWGIPLRAESLEIRSIGAGGGSIAWRDEAGALRVGPSSAGALPGPACYGGGGTDATVTDANLVLGLINPARFLGGSMPIDVTAAETAIERLAESFASSGDEVATGIHSVVNANMAQLIREMTVNRGRDPDEFSLVSFGGAGGQHAYGVAEMVGCHEVLFPQHSSAFSALGLVAAGVQTTEAQSLIRSLETADWRDVLSTYGELEARAVRNLFLDERTPYECVRRALIRYVGQTHEVLVNVAEADGPDDLYERFQNEHFALYGTRLDDPAEIVSLHATVAVSDAPASAQAPTGSTSDNGRAQNAAMPVDRRWLGLFQTEVDVFDAAALGDGDVIEGPALIEDADTVIVVPPEGRVTQAPELDALRLELVR
jgi:N-methylhydantoinase A